MRRPFRSAGALTGAVLAAPAPAPVPKVPSGSDLLGWAHRVGFASDGSGFALLARCVQDAERPRNGFCRQYVAALDRGASQWRRRASPLGERPGTDGVSAQLGVLGPGRAWVHEASDEGRDRTWFTADGGRSWQARGVKPAGKTRSVPTRRAGGEAGLGRAGLGGRRRGLRGGDGRTAGRRAGQASVTGRSPQQGRRPHLQADGPGPGARVDGPARPAGGGERLPVPDIGRRGAVGHLRGGRLPGLASTAGTRDLHLT